MLFLLACKKEITKKADCFSGSATTREIINTRAKVKEENGLFYLVEQGTIDLKLAPCNLPPNFQLNNIDVTISGLVKATVRATSAPCCTENFVITKISY